MSAQGKPQPVRLQRKRMKGFHLISPNGFPIRYVGRPSKWGNPARLNRRIVWGNLDCCPQTPQEAVCFYRQWIVWQFTQAELQEELGDKNLACWCPLDQPCHADVLLELANA